MSCDTKLCIPGVTGNDKIIEYRPCESEYTCLRTQTVDELYNHLRQKHNIQIHLVFLNCSRC